MRASAFYCRKKQFVHEREKMNTQQLKGNWQIFTGKVKEQWGKLTDDDVAVAEGKLEQLAGNLAARYGIAQEEAQRRLEKIKNDCGCHN